MKVALYYPWIYLKGGVERSLLELVERSRHQYVIYTSHYRPQNTFAGYRNLEVKLLEEVPVERSMGAVLVATLRILQAKIDLSPYDVFVVWCDGLGPLTLFRNHHLPAVNICSTPLRPVYDPVYEAAAKSKRSLLGQLSYEVFKRLFRAVDRLAWQRFALVVSTSQEVTTRIVRSGLCQEEKRLRLAHPGIDYQARTSTPSYEPFFLIAGRIMWTKNIELALEAFLEADLRPEWELVIAGFIDAKSESYLTALLGRVGLDKRVTIVKNPEDEVLRNLYSQCSAVLFPPLNEDWGIVPLEAMLASKAVVANASGGPLESVLHEKTGLLLSPKKEAWRDALTQLAQDPERCRSYGEAGRERVKEYDWSQFVSTIDAAIEDAAGLPQVPGRKDVLAPESTNSPPLSAVQPSAR